MKAINCCLLFLLYFFANQSNAWNQGGFDYKTITGHLQPTPGCKSKQEASRQAMSEYRFKKHSKALCQHIGYGWGLFQVMDKGEVFCETCDTKVENHGSYQCYVKNVVLKCRLTRRGW